MLQYRQSVTLNIWFCENMKLKRNYIAHHKCSSLIRSSNSNKIHVWWTRRLYRTMRRGVYPTASVMLRRGCDPIAYSSTLRRLRCSGARLFVASIRFQPHQSWLARLPWRQYALFAISVFTLTLAQRCEPMSLRLYRTALQYCGTFAAFVVRLPSLFSSLSSFQWYWRVWITEVRLLPVCPTRYWIDCSLCCMPPRDWYIPHGSTIT